MNQPLDSKTSRVSSKEGHDLELSVLLPCLNEAETLATCIRKAKTFLERNGIHGEILVADNGSSDGSVLIAEKEGARLIKVDQQGYGYALQQGIREALGRYVIMGDADDSYDFLHLTEFIVGLRRGDDLVVGNRFKGGIKKDAMPNLHRYLGNPVLTTLGRFFFKSPVGDFHCGLRGFNRESILGLNLQTGGMEFASEMVVKATLRGLKISEVPTSLSPDGRNRPPHLRSWRDGWRHLRFMLLYSPKWLFLYPGLFLVIAGCALGLWILPSPRKLGNATLDIHTLLYAALAVILGFQSVLFALFTKISGILEGWLPPDKRLDRFLERHALETGLLGGGFLSLLGFFGSVYAVQTWKEKGFGPLDPSVTFRTIIPSVLCIVIGIQVVFASFFLSVLTLKKTDSSLPP